MTIRITGAQGSGNLYNDAFGLRTNMGNTIVVGNYLDISTTHNSSHAIYITGNDGNDVKIGNNSKIVTNGNSANVVNVTGGNSKVKLGNSSLLTTYGDKSHGVQIYIPVLQKLIVKCLLEKNLKLCLW